MHEREAVRGNREHSFLQARDAGAAHDAAELAWPAGGHSRKRTGSRLPSRDAYTMKAMVAAADAQQRGAAQMVDASGDQLSAAAFADELALLA